MTTPLHPLDFYLPTITAISRLNQIIEMIALGERDLEWIQLKSATSSRTTLCHYFKTARWANLLDPTELELSPLGRTYMIHQCDPHILLKGLEGRLFYTYLEEEICTTQLLHIENQDRYVAIEKALLKIQNPVPPATLNKVKKFFDALAKQLSLLQAPNSKKLSFIVNNDDLPTIDDVPILDPHCRTLFTAKSSDKRALYRQIETRSLLFHG